MVPGAARWLVWIPWVVLGGCAAVGLLAFALGYWGPGYYDVLRIHVLLGEVALVAALVGIVVHLRTTSSTLLGGLVPVLLGAAFAFPAPWAMVLPEEQHDRGPWGYFVDSFRSWVAGTLADSRPLGASISLVLVLLVAFVTLLVGVLSRTRERAASRWTGASLTLLLSWALVGGHLIADLPVRALVPGQTLHSFAGMWAIGLFFLHLFAHRAASSRWPRGGVVLVAILGVVAFSALLQLRYRVARSAFALHSIRLPQQPEELAAVGAGQPLFQPVPRAWVEGAQDCGSAGCHEQVFEQWSASPHRFSADNAGYRAVVGELILAGRWTEIVICANCHDPNRVVAGTVRADYAAGVPEGGEGVGCHVCHAITEAGGEIPANGRLTVALERPAPGPDPVANLRLDARHHRDRFVFNDTIYVSRPCQACHRVELGHEVLQWQEMPEADQDGLPLYCRTCHLPPDGEVTYSHQMAGIHLDQARTVPGDAATKALVERHRDAVLRSTGFRPDLPIGSAEWRQRIDWEAARPDGVGGAPLALDVHAQIRGGGLEVETRLSNLGVGHAYPTGPFDLQEHWLELWIAGSDGRVLLHRGSLDPQGRIVDPAARLGGRELDANGQPISHHRILEITQVVDRRSVAPGEHAVDRFDFALPAGSSCPCEVRARWRFRRWNPEFSGWVLGDSQPLPTWEVAGAWAVATVP